MSDSRPGEDPQQPEEEPESKPAGHSSARLARSSALMASGTLVSRILGLVRLALLAGAIGVTTQVANAWQTANTLPNTIYLLLAGGVLNVVFVPQLTRALSRSDKGRDFTDRLITLALLAITGITVVATAGAWLLTKLYALSWTGEQLALAVALAYLCLPQIFFYGAYALLGQILNAQEKFGYYMWAPVANNIVAIIGLVIFTITYPDADTIGVGDWTASMILLLGGTATLGIVVQAAVLFEPVRRSGFRYRPRWGFRGVGLGSASRMAGWTLAVIAVSQTGLLLSSNVLNRAADLESGVAGRFVYESAFLIFILPHSLVATSLLTAMLPQLSRSAAADDHAALSSQYRHGLRLLATAMVPIAIAMIVLAPEVTAMLLLLNEGAATQATAQVVMVLTLGLVPYGVYLLSQRIFHAYQEGRPTFQLQLVITGVSVVAILTAAFLPPEYTAMGIAGGQAVGQGVAALLAVRWVRRRIDLTSMPDVRGTYGRALLAGLIAAVPTLLVQRGVHAAIDGKSAAFVALGVGGVLFFTVYGVLAHRFGVRELAEVITPISRRLRRRGPKTSNTAATAPGEPSQQPASPLTADSSGTSTRRDAEGDRSRLVLGASASDTNAIKEPMVHGIDTGTVLGGRYALDELLARRDDSLDYWSAQDQTLDRLVAVTVLPATGEHEDIAHAVLDGARRTAGVDDPRLVRVLDVGLDDGFCWIVEEGLSEAVSLATLVADHPLPAEEARRIVGESASGLESARRRGLHHLYLNPHAVLRTSEGSVKISGVGVAAAIEQTEEISAAEASVIDTGDLLAMLYTGLTGRWPGEEIEALRPARRLADGTLPAPSEVVGGVPGDLDALCRSVFGAEADAASGPHTPGELAKLLAPWPSEVVSDAQFSLDAPLSGDDSGAHAAVTTTAGASAAATAARAGRDSGRQDHTDVVEPSYYRTQPSGDGASTGTAAVTAAMSETPENTSSDASQREENRGAGAPVAGSAGAGAAGAAAGAGAPGLESTSGGQPRQRFQSGIVIALIAAVVVVAMFFGYGAIQGLSPTGGGDSQADAGQGDGSEGDGEGDGGDGDGDGDGGSSDSSEETAEPSEGDGEESDEPIEPVGITSHDPQGDGDENNELTELAIDGDSGTAWRSRTYLAENWGNLKDGVGLAIDLGEPTDVSGVDIAFPQGDYRLEVYVGDEVSRSAMTQLGVADDATEEVSLGADDAIEGQYVLIWFTEAWDGPNGEIVYVSEVTVR